MNKIGDTVIIKCVNCGSSLLEFIEEENKPLLSCTICTYTMKLTPIDNE